MEKDRVNSKQKAQALWKLSDTEVAVLAGIVRGLENTEIATFLGISVETVKCHAKEVYRKMNVSNRTQAAVKFVRGCE